MIASFLRSIDGQFDYGGCFGALLFTGLALLNVWVLWEALKTKRIPFGCVSSYSDGKIYWFERKKNPLVYWLVFIAFSLMIPLCIYAIYELCSGGFHPAP
jgi:hypothetical protein